MSIVFPWNESFNTKASIYTLNNDSKKWIQTGLVGTIHLYSNASNTNNRMIEWTKDTRSLKWYLIGSKIKPKGENAWVTKAKSCQDSKDEIIAIRFNNDHDSIRFSKTYQQITVNIQSQQQNNTLPSNSSNIMINKWMCPACTFQNDVTNNTCIICNATQQPLQTLPAINPTKWKCRMCSYQNDNPSPNLQCGMCGLVNNSLTPQQHDSKCPDEGVSTWICAVCTYTNDTDACIMCGLSVVASNQAQQNTNPSSMHQFPANNAWEFQFTSTNLTQSESISHHFSQQIPMLSTQSNLENQQKWNCPICTLPNNLLVLRCEACDTHKDTISPSNLVLHGYIPAKNTENAFKAQAHYDEKGNVTTTEWEFRRAVCDIGLHCEDAYSLFNTLMSIINKLATKDDPRYQTLDTSNPKVMERLICFEGVLDLLILLGFEPDLLGMKLICHKKPSIRILRNAMNALTSYQLRFCVGSVIIVENEQKRFTKFNEKLFKIDEVVVFGYVRKYNPLNKDIPPELVQMCAVFYYDSIVTVRRVVTGNLELDGGRLSIEQIVDWATNWNESKHNMETIIVTHKCFTDSITLLNILRQLFIQSISEHKTENIRLNILHSLQRWMKLYWQQDFMENDELKKTVWLWLDEELLNDKFRTEQNITSGIVVNLISLISRQYNCLKSLPNIRKTQRELVTLSDDKKQKKNELLVCGYVRHYYSIPSALIQIFLIFYHENIEVPAKAHRILQTCSVEDLANQITFMDKYNFDQIEERELLQQNWKKKNSSELSPNVMMLIEQFNRLTLFIQIEVLKAKSVTKRGRTIRRMIRMCERFLELRNYNSLCAVYGALNSAPIHRLKNAWGKVSEKYTEKFEEIASIFDSSFGHRNLRRLLTSAKPPCIPHIGIKLQDLVFMDDGSRQHMINSISPFQYVNFDKLIRIRETIRNIKQFQTCVDKIDSYCSIIKEDLILQKVLLLEFEKLKDITEDQIWDMSTVIKKQDSTGSSVFFMGRLRF